MEFILNLLQFYLFDWKFEDLFFLFYKVKCVDLENQAPLIFFPCPPDRHWARNFFRLEFSSNSFRIHFKFTSNYFQLHLQAHIFIFMRCMKISECGKYEHMLLGCKRIQKPGRTFSGFSRIFMELCGFKVQLALPHGSFINWRR